MWPLVFLLGLLTGCGSGFGAANHVITTDGITVSASPPGTRMVLYGPESPITIIGAFGATDSEAKAVVDSTATMWLQQHGMIVLDESVRQHVLREQSFALSNDDRVRVGKLMGADVLVFRTYSRPLATVTVKGISVETGEVLWSGSASTEPNGNARDLNRTRQGFGWNGVTYSTPGKEEWKQLANADVLRR